MKFGPKTSPFRKKIINQPSCNDRQTLFVIKHSQTMVLSAKYSAKNKQSESALDSNQNSVTDGNSVLCIIVTAVYELSSARAFKKNLRGGLYLRSPWGFCAPLIPENNSIISPNPRKKIPQLPESVFPLLPKIFKLIQLLPKSPKI